MNLVNGNGMLNRTTIVKLYVQQFPNATISEIDSFMRKNEMAIHKTLIGKILAEANQRIAAKSKPETSSFLHELIHSEIKNCIAEIDFSGIIQQEFKKLFRGDE
jgi:hypothetical protein